MGLDDLQLQLFRNHADTRLDGTGKLNLLTGENGAGKTNILEAISLFAPGRGMRRAGTDTMVSKGAGGTGFAIGANLRPTGSDVVRLGTYCLPDRPTRRMVRINGAAASAVALGEWVAVSWLTPTMDRLFAEPAGSRRQFMDRLAVAIDPSHAAAAARYSAAVRERNRLLSDDRPPEPEWLDGIEAQMAMHGAALSAGRRRLVDLLDEALRETGDGPFARPHLAYIAGGADTPDDLHDEWRRNRDRDRSAGRTLKGPHRDELEVVLASKNMPAALASTGEQKAMLIAIVLAHAELAAKGRSSILLLDEVAAHIDPLRREALFDRLRSGPAQVWLTGTESAPFSAILHDAAHWRVTNGTTASV